MVCASFFESECFCDSFSLSLFPCAHVERAVQKFPFRKCFDQQ
ncbi:MAG: SWIM zinc finger family protein [Terriglobales bacterium]